MKPLYKGWFNYYGEINILFTHAWTDDQALYFFYQQLQKIYNKPALVFKNYFHGTARYKFIQVEEDKMKLEVSMKEVFKELEPMVKKCVEETVEEKLKEKTSPKSAPRQGEGWTLSEDIALHSHFRDFAEIYAGSTGRSAGSIIARIKKQLSDSIWQ